MAGRPSASRRRTASLGRSIVSPAARAASAATIPRPPPLVTTTSRRPRGSDWLASPRATSNSSSTVSTRSAPACRAAASKARSEPANAPVCEETARAASGDRPAFSRTTGLSAAARRRASRKRRPSATPSKYPAITRVSGSAAIASSTSLSLTSAWLPSDAKREKPTRRSRAQSRIATASAPEWETKAMPPGSGMPGANVTLSRRAGRIHPRQLGPRTRIGWPRSHSRRRTSRWAPSPPTSRKPAEITTAPPTPLATHCTRTGSTSTAGTAIPARSIRPSKS